ncbi:hypothetical protein [Alteromonas stellipolaris]|uniref:hypothetical protein n=1 Tax=Alteromonas stellipolaris TaxID=233316 RepID=UPI0010FF6202|nr:hypothetical protein [Alteromonas stellipolaris]
MRDLLTFQKTGRVLTFGSNQKYASITNSVEKKTAYLYAILRINNRTVERGRRDLNYQSLFISNNLVARHPD